MRQRLILFIFAFTAVLLVASCEPEGDVFPEIEINPAEIVLTSDGGTERVVLSANCSWSMDVPSDSFIKLSPTSGEGNAEIEIVVPPTEDTEGRGLMFHVNGYLEDKINMTKLTVKQLGHPGEVAFRDVTLHDITGAPVEEIPPEGGIVSYIVEANYEWFLTANREGLNSLWDHGWMEGLDQWNSYTWFPANESGEPFEYVLVLSCFDEFGGTTDTLRVVQQPLKGSISIVSITPSSDGKTIPAAGAKMILKVNSNSNWVIRYDPDLYWPWDPDAEHLYPYGGGPGSDQLVTVPVPPFDDPEGRTIRFWLLLNNLTYETGAIEFVQRGN